MRTILYTILVAILATFFFQACSKEDVELQPSEKVATQDSVRVENRNGTTSPIYYINSNSISYHQKNYQIAFNKDSMLSVIFIRTTGPAAENYTKSLGTLDGTYKARKYDITISLTDTVLYFPATWIKDTTAITFNKIGNINLFAGEQKIYRTERKEVKMQYYDTTYKKLKTKFQYDVKLDSTIYQDFIPANNTGAVFWVNHKM